MKKINFTRLPSEELANLAYQRRKSGKPYWNFIIELHKRGTKTELGIAKNFMKREDSAFRQVAADILGQLGFKKQKFFRESEKNLISLLRDSDYKVISAAAVALGHRCSKIAIPFLYSLKNHKKQEVRFSIVYGLLSQNDPLAIEAMIELSRDRSRDVRNWATFGLGSMIKENTPEIEQALIERLNEKDLEIRGEALVGLAIRKHKNALEWTKAALSEEEIVVFFLEAAMELASRDLLPELQEIKKTLPANAKTYFVSCLEESINKCSNQATESR